MECYCFGEKNDGINNVSDKLKVEMKTNLTENFEEV